MIKVKFFKIDVPLNWNQVQVKISQYVEINYDINSNQALVAMKKRERIGSVKIDECLYLPHIETNYKCEGILLVHFLDEFKTNKQALVLIMNKNYKSKYFIEKLQNIFSKLDRLSSCKNLLDFINLMGGVDDAKE